MRLQFRQQQAEAGDIILLDGDESEALTHPYLARAWRRQARICVCRPRAGQNVALLLARSRIRALVVHISPSKPITDFSPISTNSTGSIAQIPAAPHYRWFFRVQWPHPHQQTRDGALATRAHRLTVEWLPKYAPELNDIEPVWRDLKAHHLAHHTFDDIDALTHAIHHAVDALNDERTAVPLPKLRAWRDPGVMLAIVPPKASFALTLLVAAGLEFGSRRGGRGRGRAACA